MHSAKTRCVNIDLFTVVSTTNYTDAYPYQHLDLGPLMERKSRVIKELGGTRIFSAPLISLAYLGGS